MKNQKYLFSSMLLSYNRSVRKLKRLITKSVNFRKQEILEKRIAKLFGRLTSRPVNLKKSIAMGALVGISVFSQSNLAVAQNFLPAVLNPFGLPSNMLFKNIEFTDIDSDGDQDLFANNFYNADNYFFENIGSPSNPQFGLPLINPSWMQPENFPTDFVDIDGDGDLDLLSSLYSFKNLSENIGTSTNPNFGLIQINPFSLDEEGFGSKYVDIDADGDFDFTSITTGYSYYGYGYNFILNFFENTGDISNPVFNPNPFLSKDVYNLNNSFGDVDNDGDLDITAIGLTDNYDNIIIYLENSGNENSPIFSTPEYSTGYNLPIDLGNYSLYDQDLVDINNDGDLDFFLTGGAELALNFFENEVDETCRKVTNVAKIADKPNGYKIGWDAVQGSTKCQIRGGKLGSPYTASYTKFGNEPSSVFINFNYLQPNEDYKMRVRCNCEVNDEYGPFSNIYYFSTGSIPGLNPANEDNQFIFSDESNISETKANLEVFPNPAKGSFSINTDLENYNLELRDVTGKLVYNQNNINQRSFNLDIRNIEAGTYFVRINNVKSSEIIKLMVY